MSVIKATFFAFYCSNGYICYAYTVAYVFHGEWVLRFCYFFHHFFHFFLSDIIQIHVINLICFERKEKQHETKTNSEVPVTVAENDNTLHQD